MRRGQARRAASPTGGDEELDALPGLVGPREQVAERLYAAALDAAFPLRRDGDHAALLQSLDPSAASPRAVWEAAARLLGALVALDGRCADAVRDAE